MDKKIQELLEATVQIINEFDEYGEVLQIGMDDKDGIYGPTSAIERLRAAASDF